jgi:hypothetical protein
VEVRSSRSPRILSSYYRNENLCPRSAFLDLQTVFQRTVECYSKEYCSIDIRCSSLRIQGFSFLFLPLRRAPKGIDQCGPSFGIGRVRGTLNLHHQSKHIPSVAFFATAIKGPRAASIFVSFKDPSESKNAMAILPSYQRTQRATAQTRALRHLPAQPTAKGPLVYPFCLRGLPPLLPGVDGGRRCTQTQSSSSQPRCNWSGVQIALMINCGESG